MPMRLAHSARLNCETCLPKYLQEADSYARNLVFNIINYPVVTIDIPYYDLGISHESNIRLVSDVEDNSDIPERLISGQFKRYTIGINIDDAYLFDVRVKDNLRLVEGHLYMMEDEKSENIAAKELLFENYN